MPQYNVRDILKEDIIIISHRIMEREVKPFTNFLARILFGQFWDKSFFLDGKIGHITHSIAVSKPVWRLQGILA